MKIFTLFIIICLFWNTIRNLPDHFSEKIWKNNLNQLLNELDDQINELNKIGVPFKITNMTILVLACLLEMFLVIFYTHLGTASNNMVFMGLSLFEVIICVWSFKTDLDEFKTDLVTDIDNYKYHKVRSILSSILDLVYYPIAFYFVLCN